MKDVPRLASRQKVIKALSAETICNVGRTPGKPLMGVE